MRNRHNGQHRLPTSAEGAEVRQPSIRLLVVDDDMALAQSCATILELDGHSVAVCARGGEAQEMMRRQRYDVVLLDMDVKEVPGLALLRTCVEAHPETLVVMMASDPNVESSLEAMRTGAWDYIPKPFSAEHLRLLVGRGAYMAEQLRHAQLTQHGTRRNGLSLIGVSPAFQDLVRLARRVARTDASVFITGESGSGKEVIAQFIHQNSRRSHEDMVALNCAALPEPLLESEMFGHVKGAFTGAVAEKEGLLEAANRSTLFLDELTEMPVVIQAKLLRVIQDGLVRRVGSTSVDGQVDIRFIAATNGSPQEAIEAGRLRRDLYYRLRVVPLHIPALRERPSDIPVLAEHFLTTFWTRHRRGEEMPVLGEGAIHALQGHGWPGNVRELQNVMEHAVVFLDPGREIEPENLPILENGDAPSAPPLRSLSFAAAVEAGQSYHELRDQLVGEFERNYLVSLIAHTGGSISKAARIAGVDRTTLYRFLERHGLQRRASLAPL